MQDQLSGLEWLQHQWKAAWTHAISSFIIDGNLTFDASVLSPITLTDNLITLCFLGRTWNVWCTEHVRSRSSHCICSERRRRGELWSTCLMFCPVDTVVLLVGSVQRGIGTSSTTFVICSVVHDDNDPLRRFRGLIIAFSLVGRHQARPGCPLR